MVYTLGHLQVINSGRQPKAWIASDSVTRYPFLPDSSAKLFGGLHKSRYALMVLIGEFGCQHRENGSTTDSPRCFVTNVFTKDDFLLICHRVLITVQPQKSPSYSFDLSVHDAKGDIYSLGLFKSI